MERKHTGITVPLIGTDGNIFSILAQVRITMRRGGVPQPQVERFTKEVQSAKSYDAALVVIMEYVDVE